MLSGFVVNKGNNVYISLDFDSREDADRIFKGLSEGGVVEMAMTDMFWGAYWGSCIDQFGIKWMFNYDKKD